MFLFFSVVLLSFVGSFLLIDLICGCCSFASVLLRLCFVGLGLFLRFAFVLLCFCFVDFAAVLWWYSWLPLVVLPFNLMRA